MCLYLNMSHKVILVRAECVRCPLVWLGTKCPLFFFFFFSSYFFLLIFSSSFFLLLLLSATSFSPRWVYATVLKILYRVFSHKKIRFGEINLGNPTCPRGVDFIGFSPRACESLMRICAEKIPLVSMEGRAEGQICADPWARTPISAKEIFDFIFVFHLSYSRKISWVGTKGEPKEGNWSETYRGEMTLLMNIGSKMEL